VKLIVTIGRHLPSSGARMQAAVNGGKRLLLGEAPFITPYLVNYVFAWRYSGAWRFSPSDVYDRPRTLPFAYAYPTPYSLRSTRRSWILSDSEGLGMGDGKITGTNKPLKLCNLLHGKWRV
jgi:hypothetical protein